MNDKERDRSGDGDGPERFVETVLTPCESVARRHSPRLIAIHSIAMLCVLLLSFPYISFAQRTSRPTLRGLSLNINAGVLKASDKTANFYNGNPRNANKLDYIIHSEMYGRPIWEDLTDLDLIGSSVANYSQLKVAEYGHMSYKLAFQLGIGFRYDLDNPFWAWQVRFDYARLNAEGMVLLDSGKNTSILSNQNAYVNCPVAGEEERIFFDLGIIRKFRLQNGFDLEVSLGANVNNTKVESNDIRIGRHTYSMLDVWGGQPPYTYSTPYEYVNQGGIGYGGYASVAFGFTIPAGTAMQLAYTFYYNRTKLEGYSTFSPQHALSLNVYVNNFFFFD